PLRQCLLANALEVVDVEQAGAVAVVNARVEVARHGDVEDYCGAAAAFGEHVLPTLARDDRLRRAGRAEDDVRLRQRIVEPFPRQRLPAAALRDLRRLFRTAIRDQDLLRPKLAQMSQRQLAHLAGADDKDGLVAEML